jgi:hypothetical protein
MAIISYPPEEGLYEVDPYDSLTRLTRTGDILRAFSEGRLYVSDGMSLTKVTDLDSIGLA